MHVYLFSPMYIQEAVDRWHYYPPPDNGTYSYPWLWYDGNPHGGWEYETWQVKIETRLDQPSPISITMQGSYSPQSHTGTISASYRNDSTSAITGRIIWIITEDSIYYAGTNGDVWHNHVARDYLPDQNGSTVTIPSGDSITLSQPFIIQSTWNENQCNIVTWIQNDAMQPDSTKEIWQGCQEKVMDLAAGVHESETAKLPAVEISPNPGKGRIKISLNRGLRAEKTVIGIYDVTGRHIKSVALNPMSAAPYGGSAPGISWDATDNEGSSVPAGVYILQIKTGTGLATVQLVIIE